MQMLQLIDNDGKTLNSKNFPKIDAKDIKKIYELMVTARVFDDTALKLQREGRLLTYASLSGQEAVQVASAYAFSDGDWFTTTYRDHAVWITRGFPIDKLYQYWAGDERGMQFAEVAPLRSHRGATSAEPKGLPPAIPIASHIPHAVGLAWAEKMKGTKNAAITYFGDGSTSKGDFHAAMNFAGVFKIPCVFICQNNQWAISVPRAHQTASETIAQKAQAYGFEGVLVDGNDIFAVYKATQDALQKARAGKGPTLIECYTYRMESHTTADDWKRYRDAKEVDAWKKKDPVQRLQKYMQSQKLWDEKYEQEAQEKAKAAVKDAVQKFESVPPPEEKDIFKYLYAE